VEERTEKAFQGLKTPIETLFAGTRSAIYRGRLDDWRGKAVVSMAGTICAIFTGRTGGLDCKFISSMRWNSCSF